MKNSSLLTSNSSLLLITVHKKHTITIMDTITYTELKQNLNTYMDKVFQAREPLIIVRNNNENVVLISAKEYAGLVETNYLLSNEANAAHLMKSIAQHKSGNIQSRSLYEDE